MGYVAIAIVWAGCGVFLTFAAIQWLSDRLNRYDHTWWGSPLFIALVVVVGIPGILGSTVAPIIFAITMVGAE